MTNQKYFFLMTFALFVGLITIGSAVATDCYLYDDNQTACQTASGCFWSSVAVDSLCAAAGHSSGCCMPEMGGGCGYYDGFYSVCTSTAGCEWEANDQNQEPWCSIKKIGDYRDDGTQVASTTDIGCCDIQGCWSYDGNQTGCQAVFGGLCQYGPSWCSSCCEPKNCWQITNGTMCNASSQYGGMMCTWADDTCKEPTTGIGCMAYTNQTDCLANGWCTWNSTNCTEPWGTGGEGDDWFGNNFDAHCWMFDHNPSACLNTTGCRYCNSTEYGLNKIALDSGYGNRSDPYSFCYNMEIGLCQGHESNWTNTVGGQNYVVNDSAIDSLACIDIKTAQVCDCGPLSGCHWNSTNCSQGMSQCTMAQANYTFCEAAPDATQCNMLVAQYFMPCEWNTKGTAATTDDECTFKSSFVFGTGLMGDCWSITSETSCLAAGCNWVDDYYYNFADNTMVQDSKCEPSFGGGWEDCSDACWACEHENSSGSAVTSLAMAQTACETSPAPGDCTFTADSYAPNGYGWCDPNSNYFGPSGGIGGFMGPMVGNCDSDCMMCGSSAMCNASALNNDTDQFNNCTWQAHDWDGDGVDEDQHCEFQQMAAKMQCNNDTSANCLNCKTSATCANYASCAWEIGQNITYSNYYGCYPNASYAGMTAVEICFNPGDEDQDGAFACSDANCTYDPFCGFGMNFGGMGMIAGFGMQGGVALPPGTEPIICFAYDNTNTTACEANVSANIPLAGPVIKDTGNGNVFNGTHRNTSVNLASHLNNTQLCYYHPTSFGEMFCDPIMMEGMMGDMNMNAPPLIIGTDTQADTTDSNDWLDILAIGVKKDPGKLGLGMDIYNTTPFAGCAKAWTSTFKTENKTGRYYWYIDMDMNSSVGCNVTYDNGTVISTGFEGKIALEVAYSGAGSALENTTNKTAYECLNNATWKPYALQIEFFKEPCQMPIPIGNGVVVVNIDEQDADLDEVTDVRILAVTANATNISDIAGPFSVTPGAMDWDFEDCMAPSTFDLDGDGLTVEDDPDCNMFKNFGFVKFEDCFMSGDEDNDGLTNCNDPDCKWAPMCTGTGVNAVGYVDTTAPVVIWKQVDEYYDGAFIAYDTNEPSNGTVLFYRNISGCTGVVNNTILDDGLFTILPDYKNKHIGAIDNFAGNPEKLGYNLAASTTYFYQLKTCDSNSNCAVSKCLNFTTEASSAKKDCPKCEITVKFEYAPSTGAATTAPTGDLSFIWDWNNDGLYNDTNQQTVVSGQLVGAKVNKTEAWNSSLEIDNPNSTIDWGIEIKNSKVTKSAMTDEFKSVSSTDIVAGTTTTSTGATIGYVGASSDFGDQIEGLSPEFCEIKIPGNSDELWHCDDSLANCVDMLAESNEDVDGDGVDDITQVSQTADYTKWHIPCEFSTWSGGQPGTYSPGTTSPGTSLGGGATGAAAKTESISETFTVIANIANKMLVMSTAIHVTAIEFTLGVDISDVELKIVNLLTKPTIVTTPTTDIYQYIEITPKNIEEGNVKDASITFTVTKQWLVDHGIDKSNVILLRWASSKWNELETSFVSESTEDYTFKAITSGFSYFAISGKTGAAVTPTGEEEEAPTGAAVGEEEEEITSANWWFIIGVIIIALVIVGYGYYKQKKTA